MPLTECCPEEEGLGYDLTAVLQRFADYWLLYVRACMCIYVCACVSEVNECAVGGSLLCPNTSLCVNTAGSYHCHCETGYEHVPTNYSDDSNHRFTCEGLCLLK